MLGEIGNHLWQSTLVALAVAGLAALLRGYGAHVRYWLWWAASIKFLVPFAVLVSFGNAIGQGAATSLAVGEWPVTLERLAAPIGETGARTPFHYVVAIVWALGTVGVFGRWIVRAHETRKLVRSSVGCTVPSISAKRSALEVRATDAGVEPALVGLFRPVLLLPHAIEQHLTQAQLEAVVEHELAHWRRRDNLMAAAHMLVEALFWFHPLVWWIGARLIEERERACDEAVLRAGHDGRVYADAILGVCERYVASRLDCAAGISGAELERRVVEIVRSKVMHNLSLRNKLLLGSLAAAAGLLPIVYGAVAQGADEIVPLVRINPEYPRAALEAGREGEVELEFTIAANGTIRDVVVVQSSAAEFEEPAMAALLRWRYQPTNMECVQFVCRVRDDLPAVERHGVRTVIDFRLGNYTVPSLLR